MREAERAKKEVEDELSREKASYEMSLSSITSKLNKADVELGKTRDELELAWQRADTVSNEVEAVRREVK